MHFPIRSFAQSIIESLEGSIKAGEKIEFISLSEWKKGHKAEIFVERAVH